MGLDSVELVMSAEKLFGIRIPDKEAEKINTVQEFADAVCHLITINPSEKCLKQIMFYKIRSALKTLNFSNKNITPDTVVRDLFPKEHLNTNWLIFQSELGLSLPKLAKLDYNANLNSHIKLFGIKTIKRTLPTTKGTIRQLIDWIISLNFKKTIDINRITNKYEVERIIANIIHNNMGIPITEIELEHSISNDLGID